MSSEYGDPAAPSESLREAFQILGNETRLEALLAIWTADEEPVSFSTIKEFVSTRDNGNIVYHLDKLTGRFVEHHEREGYSLLPAGTYLVHVVKLGYLESTPDVEPTPFGESCPACGGALEFSYRGTIARVECGDCGRAFAGQPLTPGALEARTVPETVEALNLALRSAYRQYRAGVCSYCQAPVERSVVPSEDVSGLDVYEVMDASDGPHLRFECPNCEALATAPAGALLFWVPEAVAFFAEHGVALADATLWGAYEWTRGNAAWVGDDGRLQITAVEDGEELRVEFDDELAAVSVTRTRLPR